ncbi:MAG: hypothetical protein ABF459_04450 [Gluconobacter cerinus]|uniref:hypothetical protein n=1 Tax=Gluconobacter cerinus TaxID=38307 RepID=UPI0039ED5E0E
MKGAWLRTGVDVLVFRGRSFPDDLIEVHHTDELWKPKKLQPATDEGAPTLV